MQALALTQCMMEEEQQEAKCLQSQAGLLCEPQYLCKWRKMVLLLPYPLFQNPTMRRVPEGPRDTKKNATVNTCSWPSLIPPTVHPSGRALYKTTAQTFLSFSSLLCRDVWILLCPGSCRIVTSSTFCCRFDSESPARVHVTDTSCQRLLKKISGSRLQYVPSNST